MRPRLLAIGLLFAVTMAFAACSGDSTETPTSMPESAQATAAITPDLETAKPAATPAPTVAPAPVATPVPTTAPAPVATPVPTTTPAPVATPVPTTTPAPVVMEPTLIPTPVEPEGSAAVEESEPLEPDDREYLTEVIPPCTPMEGTDVNPCDAEGTLPFGIFSLAGGSGLFDQPEPVSLRYWLDGGFAGKASSFGASHLAVRGTFIPNSVRCTSELFRQPSYVSGYVADGYDHTYKCYADLQVSEYLLGNGPSRLTLWIAHEPFNKYQYLSFYHNDYGTPGASWEEADALYRRAYESFFNGNHPDVPGGIFNKEQIHLIGPSYDVGTEVWHRKETMDVQQDEQGNVYVVHPDRDGYFVGKPAFYEEFRAQLEIPLATFRTQISAAQQERITAYNGRAFPRQDAMVEGAALPAMLNDAHNLPTYYTEIEAQNSVYGPPKPPPPACYGTAVPNGNEHPWLVGACIYLLEGKDMLRGTVELNWALDQAITAWDGITVRVVADEDDLLGDLITHLDLADTGLNGTIPPGLGSLHTLTVLKLNGNVLTGHIPTELGRLTNLTELKLSGNNLTGCVPASLRDVANNDLNELGLGDCMDPGEEFRPKDSLTFTSSAYTFTIGEDAKAGAMVGSVVADPGRLGVTYSIIAGNDSGIFAIGSETGAITVAAALDYETTTTYTLTVQAEVVGVTSATTVTVNVTDVAEDPPPAPSGLDVTLADGTFTISWAALDGAAKYEAQHTTAAANAATVTWAALPETTGVRVTYAPDGGPACSTEYRFRVRAYGDGATYTETWGAESDAVSVETAGCAPAFDQDSYTFEVAEDAAVGDAVGTVPATDPDQADILTYSITEGNEDGNFAIDGSTGAITVAAALDYETTSEYTLTVEVSDGNGGSDTAAVTVTVTDVAEDAPPAPSGLAASLAGETFTISWTALDGAAKYEVQHTTDAASAAAVSWTALPETTGVLVTYAPDGGPACSTEYRFRVPGYWGNGDGQPAQGDHPGRFRLPGRYRGTDNFHIGAGLVAGCGLQRHVHRQSLGPGLGHHVQRPSNDQQRRYWLQLHLLGPAG